MEQQQMRKAEMRKIHSSFQEHFQRKTKGNKQTIHLSKHRTSNTTINTTNLNYSPTCNTVQAEGVTQSTRKPEINSDNSEFANDIQGSTQKSLCATNVVGCARDHTITFTDTVRCESPSKAQQSATATTGRKSVSEDIVVPPVKPVPTTTRKSAVEVTTQVKQKPVSTLKSTNKLPAKQVSATTTTRKSVNKNQESRIFLPK